MFRKEWLKPLQRKKLHATNSRLTIVHHIEAGSERGRFFLYLYFYTYIFYCSAYFQSYNCDVSNIYILRYFMRLLVFRLYVMASLFSICSCSLLQRLNIKEGYLPSEVNKLVEKYSEYKPIWYYPKNLKPYNLNSANKSISNIESFMSAATLSSLLDQSIDDDYAMYIGIHEHFKGIDKHPLLSELKDEIQSKIKLIPKEIVIKKDEFIGHSTSTDYAYPLIKDARIQFNFDNTYVITMPDGTIYRNFSNGNYSYTKSLTRYYYNYYKATKTHVLSINDTVLRTTLNKFSINTLKGSLIITPGKENTVYEFAPADSEFTYFLYKDNSAFVAVNKSKVEFVYFPKTNVLQIIDSTHLVHYTENIERYDVEIGKQNNVYYEISTRLPEGIFIKDIDSDQIPTAEISLRYPIPYISKTIGTFTFLYTEKDDAYIQKLDPDKLEKINKFCTELTGLKSNNENYIIIPPDLDSFEKTYIQYYQRAIKRLPFGFADNNIIVLWPLSVPRYYTKEGQDQVFSSELYDTITHEYTHNLIEKSSGIIYRVPLWLHEGLALYVETRWSQYEFNYWTKFFEAINSSHCFLKWDDITLRSTSSFSFGESRVHYAQSYGMVSYLIKMYGMDKVREYILSFRISHKNMINRNLVISYKENFEKVFGVKFDTVVAESKIGNPD
jgi:hypothetical protein